MRRRVKVGMRAAAAALGLGILAPAASPLTGAAAPAAPAAHSFTGAALATRAPARQEPYADKAPPLSTRWTAAAQRARVPLPEYPRPELRRRRWLNLNGYWGFETATAAQRPNFTIPLRETIKVPFPPQSALSGIMRNSRRSFYERSFTIPRSWRGQHVLLHFGAVSYRAEVYVNGRHVGGHRGDFDPFSFDITRELRPGRNQLFVVAVDPGARGGQPVGKQRLEPAGAVWFTAASGIWQTVWLEPVPSARVERLDIVPEPDRGRVLVTARVVGADPRQATIRLSALEGTKVVARAGGRPDTPVALRISHPRLWSPGSPFLYGLDAQLQTGRRTADRVASYFGMRSISLGKVAGVTRILLNGKFVFQDGVLDQGYWPDGVYTAPSDAALRYDLQEQRALGFNMVLEHEKVEPDRWYYWADRLGLLVWQDMPSMSQSLPPPSRRRRRQFSRELERVVAALQPHPSIIGWIPFNEGWGAFDVGQTIAGLKRLDPTRLVDGDSGSFNCCGAPEPGTTQAGGGSGGDVRDSHMYMGPFAPPPDTRASMIGEYGGMLDQYPSHEWDPARASNLARDEMPDAPAACARYQELTGLLRQELATPGVSAAAFTEWTDVEDETDGVMTYDRALVKCDPAVIRSQNQQLMAASTNPADLGPPRAALPAGQVGYWPLDEGSGSIAHDRSGGGHDLTLRNGAGWAPGRGGAAALRLGGSGQAAQAAAPILDTTKDFTVAAWVSPSNGHDGSVVADEGEQTNAFALRLQSERFGFAMPERDLPLNPGAEGVACPPLSACLVRASNRYVGLQGDGRENVQPGSWYFLVGVRRSATQSIVFYLNGEPADSRWLGAGFAATGPFSVGAGRAAGGIPDGFAGLVQDVRIWSRGLTSWEVSQLYRAELGP